MPEMAHIKSIGALRADNIPMSMILETSLPLEYWDYLTYKVGTSLQPMPTIAGKADTAMKSLYSQTNNQSQPLPTSSSPGSKHRSHR